MAGSTTTAATTPRLWAALRVIAGRGVARACMQVSMVVLLPLWGAERFGPFVAATGAFTWLTFLVLGAEKAALTALPRNRVLRPRLTRMLVTRAALPLVVAGVCAVLPFGDTWSLYAAAAVYASAQGLFSVLASLNRFHGHADRETAAYLGFALWVAAMAGLAFAGVLQPYGYLLGLIVGMLVGAGALAFGLEALRRRGGRGGALRAMVDRRVILLGLSDVAGGAGISVLYVVLAAVGRPADAATVYVVLLISSVLGSLGMLVLRLLQPATAMRLRGTGARVGRRQAASISGWAAAVGGAFLTGGAVTLLIALVTQGSVRGIADSTAALAVTVAVEMPLFCVVLYVVFLLENTTGSALWLTSSTAIAGLVATTAVALVVIPVLHAVGAVAALVVSLTARSVYVRLRLRSSMA